MAGELITVPSFEFSAFYYPEILESLVNYKRRNVPELTDESEFEPFMQLIRAFALVGHLNNVLLDMIANEATLPTARLPESVRNMLRLIDYRMKPAAPATTDVVYKLSRVLAAETEVVTVRSQVATQRSNSDEPTVFFEALEGVVCQPTNRLGAMLFEDAAGVFTDHTVLMQAGAAFTVTLEPGCKLYYGHETAMWTTLRLAVSSPSSVTIGCWEYYDGETRDVRPDNVSDPAPGSLRFDVNSLLGASNRTGALVRVMLNSTGHYEDVLSAWDGANNFVTTTLLGQSSVSFSDVDYTVGTAWKELDSVSDATNKFQTLGTQLDVKYPLPQTDSANWRTATLEGIEAYYIRFRVVATGAPVGTTLSSSTPQGDVHVKALVTQGRSAIAETLGSSNGAPNQKFVVQRDNFISESEEVRVSAVVWTRVDNFLDSNSQDQHYTVELGDKDRATVAFGDGKNGAIPPIGQGNLVIDYRYGADANGNVGANTITVDKTGLTVVSSLYNPRMAIGWAKAQSADKEGLERAKIEGPASLRLQRVALGPDDLVQLVLNYRDDGGSKPFGRAKAIEGAFGPKTTELVVVGRGGSQATPEQLEELALYINGDRTANPPKPKRFVANQEVVPTNFETHEITIKANVEAPKHVTPQQVANRLRAIIQPEALKDDGVSYVWDFGDEVPTSRIQHEIFSADNRITEVELLEPLSNVPLANRALPLAVNIDITIVESL